jgi:cell division GTPase FtsZ
MVFLIPCEKGVPPEDQRLRQYNHEWLSGRSSAVVVDAPAEPDDAELRLAKMVSCISNMLLEPSIINLDLADLRTIMRCGTEACIISGRGLSPESALRDALDNSLVDMRRARGCLLHITGGDALTLRDANHIAESMTGAIDPEANVIWGMRVKSDVDRIEITAVITGKNIMRSSRNTKGWSWTI